jgi:hypothetical protein
MMPQISRTVVHEEGVALIGAYIAAMAPRAAAIPAFLEDRDAPLVSRVSRKLKTGSGPR